MRSLPFILPSDEDVFDKISDLSQKAVEIAKADWSKYEYGWDFKQSELIRIKGGDIDETFDLFKTYWTNKFTQLQAIEQELNESFIKIYGLEDELHHNVPIEEITILKEELSIKTSQLVFNEFEVFKQFALSLIHI